MTRPLIVFYHGDFTTRENGAQVRMSEMLSFLCSIVPRVIVYSFHEHPSHPWTSEGEARFRARHSEAQLVLEHRSGALGLLTRLKAAALALVPQFSGRILRARLPSATPLYTRLVTDEHGLLMVNYVDGLMHLNGIVPGTILETHDVKFASQAKRFHSKAHALWVVRKFRSEVACLDEVDTIVAISPVDQSVFKTISDRRVLLVPTYAEIAAERGPVEGTSAPPTYDLLFVGSLNRFNVDGLAVFLSDNAGWLKDYSIAIAGAVGGAEPVARAAAALPKASILGFVDDLAPLYRASRAVISPVDGTGLKIKVVEALAHGRPVFGSEHSRDALPAGYEGCVFDLDRASIEALLADSARLAAASTAADAYYRRFQEAGDRGALADIIRARLTRPG